MTDPQTPQQPPAYQPPAETPAAYTPPPAAAPYDASAYGAAPAPVPGKTLGIVALVVVFFAALVGLILGFVARSQSKKAGVQNTPATVAIVLGFVFIALTIVATIIAIAIFAPLIFNLVELCSQYGPGEHVFNGVPVTCG